MKRIKPGIWFLVFWLFISGASGIWKYISEPPVGIHQGAQCDRASVAWNYYHYSMNFLEPRVMENRLNFGVAGMEFPVVNYMAAVLYKIFGPHEVLYRLLVFLIVTFGVYAAWLVSGFFIRSLLHRFILISIWFLSPIYLFYSISFIPDPVAMSFCMMALFFFFRYYYNIQITASRNWYIFFISLAGLVKITFLISHIAVVMVFILFHWKKEWLPMGMPKVRYSLAVFIAPVIPVIAWYTYSSWLTQKTGNIHFLQQINPAKNLHEFIDNTSYAYNTWQNSLYANHIFAGIILLFIFSLVFRFREAPLLAAIALLLLLGSTSAFVLFNFQYRYHDYYFFIFFPAIFFMLLFLQQIYLEGKRMFSGILPIAVLIAFYILPFHHFFHSNFMLKERFTKGSYYYQQALPEQQFYHHIQKVVDSLVPKNEEIISVFDGTPNTTLYFMRRQGIRIATDFPPELARDVLHSKKLHYMVLNDSTRWHSQFEPVTKLNKKLLYKKDVISIWKISDSTYLTR